MKISTICVFAVILLIIANILSGCNTVNGFGEDVDSWIISGSEVQLAETRAYYLGQQGLSLK